MSINPIASMIQVQYIQQCQCGAMTVTFEDGASNSMSREMFDRLGFTGKRLPQVFYNCNHCVNHWGLDLCKCGSGMPVGHCDCGSSEASEELGVKRPFVGWVF